MAGGVIAPPLGELVVAADLGGEALALAAIELGEGGPGPRRGGSARVTGEVSSCASLGLRGLASDDGGAAFSAVPGDGLLQALVGSEVLARKPNAPPARRVELAARLAVRLPRVPDDSPLSRPRAQSSTRSRIEISMPAPRFTGWRRRSARPPARSPRRRPRRRGTRASACRRPRPRSRRAALDRVDAF